MVNEKQIKKVLGEVLTTEELSLIKIDSVLKSGFNSNSFFLISKIVLNMNDVLRLKEKGFIFKTFSSYSENRLLCLCSYVEVNSQ